jgi:PAS domain S-box-containing protein
VVIGIPAEEIDGPLTSILMKLGLLAGALILFALALAWLVGREIVRRQDTLRQERQRFKIFLDSASDAISIVDAQGQLTEYSHSFAELLGYGAQDIAGLKMQAWCGETTVDGIFRSAGESFNTTVLSQQRYRRRDGSLVDVEVASHMLVIDDQRSLYCAARDVTDRNRMDAELAAALELAESSAIAKSVFLANMNHEIRTPLNGIMGMAYLLGSPEIEAGQRIDYAEAIMDSGKRLLRLLGDILELAAIEDRRVKLMTKEINPVHLMRDVVELFLEKSLAKGLPVAHRLEGEPTRYLGDSYRLTQMLSHLLSNAINFSAQGAIWIEARELSRTDAHAMLEFSVMDKGIGIAAEKHALLFQNFSQIDNLMSRKQDGAGIGLSMVRHLAELMDGEVGFESQLGQGARFWFRIKVQLVTARGRKAPYVSELSEAPT